MRQTISFALATTVALAVASNPGCGSDTATRTPAAAESPGPEPEAPAAAAEPRLPAIVAGEYELAGASRTRPLSERQYVRVTADKIAIGNLEASARGYSEAKGIVEAELAERLDWIHYETGMKARAAAEKRAAAEEQEEEEAEFGGTGAKMSLDEGKMGQRESGRSIDDDDDGDGDDDDDGVYLTGTSEFSPDLDDRTVYGGLLGDEVGEMKGGFGFGVAGLGPVPGSIGKNAPLLVADKSTKLTRIAAVVAALCHHGARLAVVAGEGSEALEHQVVLGRFSTRTCDRAPSAHQDLGDAAKKESRSRRISLVAAGFRLGDGADDKVVAPTKLAASLPVAAGAGDTFLVLIIEDEAATVAELIALLDAAAAAGYGSVYLGEPGALAAVTGWGTIGTGRYGTGSGYGRGGGRGSGRVGKVPVVRIGAAVAKGDLDKNIIRRYIRRNVPKVRYCYEKRLLVEPGLKGKVVVDFTIDASGKVSSATAKGFDAQVSSCVASVIEAIQFPKPRGGGLVKVHYPFNFATSGG